MKQAIPNIRAIVDEMHVSLPSFPANRQGEIESFALRISSELDILEGASRGVTAKPAAPTTDKGAENVTTQS